MPQHRRIVIAGAGSLGRELASWIRDENEMVDIAFIDDTLGANKVDRFEEGALSYAVLGKIDPEELLPQDSLLIAVANPMLRQMLDKRMGRNGGTFLHKSSRIARSAFVGTGSMIFPHSIVSVGASIGRSVVVNVLSSIGHDVEIGQFSTLSSHVDLCGHVRLGERVFVGSGARVLPGLHIGDGAVIGAGAVVMRDVEDGETVAGNPARRVK